MIIDDLIGSLHGDAPVRDLLVGAHVTVVCSRYCGLASTLASVTPHARLKVRDAGRLHLKSARELAAYAASDNPLEASIGLAAVNSLLDVDEGALEEVNAAELLAEHGRNRRVAIVGHFPFVERLRDRVGELWVIELEPTEGDHPAEAAPDLIPGADVVAITGSTLVNHTLDGLLRLCRPGAAVMLIGPSTPLSPVLFDWGVTVLAGARVFDEAAVLRHVAQGASFPQAAGARRVAWVRGGGSGVA